MLLELDVGKEFKNSTYSRNIATVHVDDIVVATVRGGSLPDHDWWRSCETSVD